MSVKPYTSQKTSDKVCSYLVSFILHGVVVLLIAFWPDGEPPKQNLMDMPVLDLRQVTIGGPASSHNPNAAMGTGTPAAPGKSKAPENKASEIPTLASLEKQNKKASENASNAAEEAKKIAEAKAKKEEQDAQEAEKKAEAKAKKEEQDAQEAKKKAEAEKKAEEAALLAKKKAEEAKKKAEEEAKKKAEEAKKKAEEEAKKKAEADAKKKADTEAKKKADEEAKKKAEAEAKKKAEADAKKTADADAKKKAKGEADAKAARDKKILDDALRQALLEAGGDDSGAGGTTPGATGTGTVGLGSGDGVGVLGSYVDSCVSRIRPNFTTSPRADHKVFTVQVRIEVAPDGRIIDAAVVSPSGDGAFDASVIQAVRVTEYLERPPRPQDQRVTLTFNSDMTSGM